MTNRALTFLRIILFSLLILLLFKPVFFRPESGSQMWAVLLDSSRSMKVADPTPRSEVAKKILRDVVKVFPKGSYFQFSDHSEPFNPKDLSVIASTGMMSNISESLLKMGSQNQVKGIILLSDGKQVGVGDPVTVASSISKPVFVIGLGNQNAFKDAAIRSIQAPPFAFKNVATTISAVVSLLQFKNQTVSIALKKDGRVVGSQNLTPQSESEESTVQFSWTPESIGSAVLSVEISADPKEATFLNNKKEISIDVGRDRFRVLYLCGSPGPEYGFLRHQFKSDPGVELVTFVILRNAQNQLNVADGELSLIPFPTQDVLVNQLATFDLVVFEEFSFADYGLSPDILLAIKKKVIDGGSFLLSGSSRVLGPQSQYNIPAIKDMLPVEIGGEAVHDLTEKVQFIPVALSHPVMRVDENPKRNEEIWKSLPALEAVTSVPAVKPGAIILGQGDVGGKKIPILTAWKFGAGRVGVLSTETTWRWAMVPGQKNTPINVYQQFWKNMVLWLTRSSEYKSVRVGLEGKSLKKDDSGVIRVWVYDEYFKPLSDAEVSVQVVSPDGKSEGLKPRLESEGVYSCEFKSDQLGVFKLSAFVNRHGQKYGEDHASFRVIQNQAEDEDLRPDFKTLRDIADVSSGRFVMAQDFSPELLKEFDQEISKTQGHKILLWNSPWFFGLIVLILCVEWFIRKKRGLP